MADTTPTYGFPFLELGDPPDLAAGTEDLATAVEAKIVTVDATTTSLDARLDLLEALSIRIVRKTADTSRTNNTPLADPHLTLTVAASTRYRVRAVCFFTVAGSNDGVDIKAGFSVPAGCTFTYSINGPDLNIASGSAVAGQTWQAYLSQTAANSTGVVGVTDDGAIGTPVILEGILNVGVTAGSVAVMWAQNVTSANQITLRTDSYLEYMKVT